MQITLDDRQYQLVSLNATPGASKRILAACRAGDAGSIILTLDDPNILAVLQAINPADPADAATKARWSTMRGGGLLCQPMR